MASMNFVKSKLERAGLTVTHDDELMLVEDSELDFERSHYGVKGISDFLRETLDEYEMAREALLEEGPAPEDEQAAPADEAENPYPSKEEPMNIVEYLLNVLGRNVQPAADPPVREFAPEPPVKEHAPVSEQLRMAREFHSCKEVAQATEIDNQDVGGVPNPVDYIRDMKLQEVAMAEKAVAVLVKGQRFMAPTGWKIKEVRPVPKDGADVSRIYYYGSILQSRKMQYEEMGSKFALVSA